MSQVEYEKSAANALQEMKTEAGSIVAAAGSIMATGPQTAREAITHPEFAVDKQCADLDCALDSLGGLLDELKMRLDPVLNPAEREEGNAVRGPEPMQSRLAAFMEHRTLRTWAYGRVLRDLIDRLEV